MALPNQKTFLQFQQEIAREVLGLDIATTTDRPSLAEVKQFINDAYQEVCAMTDWGWLYREGTFNTAIGQQTPYTPITGTTGTAEVLWMTIPAENRRLAPMSSRDYINLYPSGYSNFSNGIPTFYVESYNDSSNQMSYLLGPCPADDVYTIKFAYKLVPSVMTSDGAVPVVPAPYQNLIKYKALIDIYRFLGPGSTERMAAVQREFQRLSDLAWKDDQNNGELIRSRLSAAVNASGAQGSLDAVLWHSNG